MRADIGADIGAGAGAPLDAARPLLKSLAGLRDHGLRAARCQRALLEVGDDAALDLLAALIGRCLLSELAALEAYLSLFTALCDLKAHQGGLDLSLRLREAHLMRPPDPQREAVAACLLTSCPPHRRAPAASLEPRGSDRELTLGHKLSRAALPTRDAAFERLLLDPHPAVVARLCLNPRLTLQDLLRVASRRPTHAQAQWAIAQSPQWLAQPALRAALAFNPYSETTLGLHLLPTLPPAEVSVIAAADAYHPTLRAAAQLIQGCRARLSRPQTSA